MGAFKKQLADEVAAAQAAEEAAAAAQAESEKKVDDGVCRIMFDPPHYTVMESVGTFEVTIIREGGDMNTSVQVDYKTEDGTAASPGDYIEAVGTLTFGPGETQKMVTLEVLDDDVFEEDEHFYIRISNLRRKDGKAFSEISVTGEDGVAKMQPSIQLGSAPFPPHCPQLPIKSSQVSQVMRSMGERCGHKRLQVVAETGSLLLIFHCYFLQYNAAGELG